MDDTVCNTQFNFIYEKKNTYNYVKICDNSLGGWDYCFYFQNEIAAYPLHFYTRGFGYDSKQFAYEALLDRLTAEQARVARHETKVEWVKCFNSFIQEFKTLYNEYNL